MHKPVHRPASSCITLVSRAVACRRPSIHRCTVCKAGAFDMRSPDDMSPVQRAKHSGASKVAAEALPTASIQDGVSLADRAASPTFGKRQPPQPVVPDIAAPVRKTKIVCTIGPATSSRDALFALADAGMNVARLNMSHGDHKSHKKVVDLIKEYNSLGRKYIAILLDTKGPEVRSGDLKEPIELEVGDNVTFTIEPGADGSDRRIGVNYDGFIDDAKVGDRLLVDGGIISFDIVAKSGSDVHCRTVDAGTMASRRHLNIRGKSANLPAITDRDWADINFGIECGVDYYALSFVRDGQVIRDLKEYLADRGAAIGVLAKIESADSVKNLEDILDVVDGAMVARGDLGAELPYEEVPYWQQTIINGCRKRGKPVIVATNMLESMISNPTATRAEVSDIAIAVRQGTDAVMLSGETAYGKFPMKAVDIMSTVSARTEASMRIYQGTRRFGSESAPPIDWITPPENQQPLDSGFMSEMFAYHATTMSNTLNSPLLVFTRKGNMPALLSHYRPDNMIFAFSENEDVLRRLALYHAVVGCKIEFESSADLTFDKAVNYLVARGFLQRQQRVAIVQSGRQPIWRSQSTHAIQVRKVPKAPVYDSDTD